jgi:hypothetical protein
VAESETPKFAGEVRLRLGFGPTYAGFSHPSFGAIPFRMRENGFQREGVRKKWPFQLGLRS